MAFATDHARHQPAAAINITPLVDVMLVLLVIFMIAAPVVTRRIDLTLPGTAPTATRTTPPPPIALRIDAAGQLYWNGDAITADGLQARLEGERQRHPDELPTLQIDPDADADYGVVARVLAAANNADWTRIGFVRI